MGAMKDSTGQLTHEAALVADKMLKKNVIGKNALAHEAIWNGLFKANRHSRGSHYLMGMSAIDNVLWDLKGRIVQPTGLCIAGGDRKEVQVYGSCLGFSHEPKAMQAAARRLKDEGYVHQKWFLNSITPD